MRAAAGNGSGTLFPGYVLTVQRCWYEGGQFVEKLDVIVVVSGVQVHRNS